MNTNIMSMRTGIALFERIQWALSPLVVAYAVLLIVVPILPLLAQRNNDIDSREMSYEIRDLSRRMATVEQVNTAVASLDKRLTVMEALKTTVDESNNWQKAVSGGIGLLLLEAISRMVKGRAKQPSSE